MSGRGNYFKRYRQSKRAQHEKNKTVIKYLKCNYPSIIKEAESFAETWHSHSNSVIDMIKPLLEPLVVLEDFFYQPLSTVEKVKSSDQSEEFMVIKDSPTLSLSELPPDLMNVSSIDWDLTSESLNLLEKEKPFDQSEEFMVIKDSPTLSLSELPPDLMNVSSFDWELPTESLNLYMSHDDTLFGDLDDLSNSSSDIF